jgi:hypothetical protein
MSQQFAIGAEMQRTSAQSIPNTTDTLIQWNSTVRDDASFFSSGANTKLTVQQSGWYAVSVSARFAANTTGGRFLWFKLNGSFTSGPVGASHPTSNDDALNASWNHYFAKGDYIEIDLFQTSGGALNLNTATLSMVRLPGATVNAF